MPAILWSSRAVFWQGSRRPLSLAATAAAVAPRPLCWRPRAAAAAASAALGRVPCCSSHESGGGGVQRHRWCGWGRGSGGSSAGSGSGEHSARAFATATSSSSADGASSSATAAAAANDDGYDPTFFGEEGLDDDGVPLPGFLRGGDAYASTDGDDADDAGGEEEEEAWDDLGGGGGDSGGGGGAVPSATAAAASSGKRSSRSSRGGGSPEPPAFTLDEETVAYWRAACAGVARPQALEQLRHIDWSLPMGTRPRPPSGGAGAAASDRAKTVPAFAEFLELRRRLPRAVILMRVGDFYECLGWDAVLAIEHCGLNAMSPEAGVPMAGCQWRQLRRTLSLLVAAGFTVVSCLCAGRRRGGACCKGRRRCRAESIVSDSALCIPT